MGGVHTSGGCLSTGGVPTSEGVPTGVGTMGLETGSDIIHPLDHTAPPTRMDHGIRDRKWHFTPLPPVFRQTLVKTLPFLAVGKYDTSQIQ